MNISFTGWGNAQQNLDDAHLDRDRLAHYRRYSTEYFNDEFRFHQGTEEILDVLAEVNRAGDWLDLGSGPSTLFWSLALREVSSISCCDVHVEALKALDEFVSEHEVPTCYRQVLDMYERSPGHIATMRRRVRHYYAFDAMGRWPAELDGSRYGLLTEFGLFGLSPSPDAYLQCFCGLAGRLVEGGQIAGADWVRSQLLIEREGHDNSYLSPALVAQAAGRAGARLRYCERIPIFHDPLYDAVMVWRMTAG